MITYGRLTKRNNIAQFNQRMKSTIMLQLGIYSFTKIKLMYLYKG